jgi:uncharacterized protein YbcC (UPF0753/DUF2309 family)
MSTATATRTPAAPVTASLVATSAATTPDACVDTWIAKARRFLPLQNPLWAFVHNNILQEYEDRPFEDGVFEAAALYRARPYEEEAFYRAEFARGRIARSCLDAVLRERVPALEGDRVDRFLADESVGDTRPPKHLVPGPAADHLVRYSVRDRPLLDLLVPLVSTFLDQQMASWGNPWRDEDFWRFFVEAVGHGPSFGLEWSGPLRERLRLHAGRAVDDVIVDEVTRYASPGQETDYVLQTLFILKGWSGMISRFEMEPDVAPVGTPRIGLKSWLAAMLVAVHALEVWLQSRDLDPPNPDPIAWPTVGLGRLALWQDAYERSFAVALLRRLVRHTAAAKTTASTSASTSTVRSARQAIVCMDDRNESFRRALEAPDIDVETIGGVGYFGVDMYYRALGANKATRQCPPVVTPTRTIIEQPRDATGAALVRLHHLRESASIHMFHQSRALVRGVLASIGLGLTSFFPLVVQTLFPSALARVRRAARNLVRPEAHARIVLDGDDGYDVRARADIVLGTMQTAGLRGLGDEPGTPLAPVVAVIAHQSTTTNNPFRQAYGCGACSGNSGRPNARAFVQMANSPEVRTALAARGFVIPDDTLFIAVLHDTTADTIELLDRDAVPTARLGEVEDVVARLSLAARRQAVERTRRFFGAPSVTDSDAGALRAAAHVLQRAHDLAQPRPEWGHNRVAACIVGRRALTRGLNLDRRAFLVSYDAATDVDGSLLRAAVLGSVPVAVNIGLDYYFSRVDPDGFGAGSKLPLNVASLLGVITGSKSDLRIGLARQMVELHEPMRILVVIEARLAHLHTLIASHTRMRRLVENGWMRLVRCDPDDGALTVWHDGAFVPVADHLGGDDIDDEIAARHFDPAFDRIAGGGR